MPLHGGVLSGVLFGHTIYISSFYFDLEYGSSFAFIIDKTDLILMAEVGKCIYVFCLYMVDHLLCLFYLFSEDMMVC